MSSQTADGFEYRCCRALALREKGWTQVQIAQALGVTQGAVSQWEKAYHQHGRLGLVRKKAAGPTVRLDGGQRQRLLGLLAGQVRPLIDRVFPLAEAAAAHARMEASVHVGKLVLAVDTAV